MNETDAFAATVHRYCEFIEEASSLALNARVRRAFELLAELVHAAARLPEGGGDSPDAEGEVDLPVNWPGFGQMVSYWEVFDPYEEDEPVGGSLTDDLLDIYRDLGRGLLAWNSGARESALWDWKFHFELHWGDHAVDALRALKRACYRLGT
ncbi:MAG: DUF5063 domain-containing protein [Planctomycetia bacterium]|nr:DUF5063 domain-containing protein [Planctomycetia bacterium]